MARKKTITVPIPSKRTFIISFICGNDWACEQVNLEWILNEDTEAAYALSNQLDRILDMKPGEYLHLSFNRDTQWPGTIARIE